MDVNFSLIYARAPTTTLARSFCVSVLLASTDSPDSHSQALRAFREAGGHRALCSLLSSDAHRPAALQIFLRAGGGGGGGTQDPGAGHLDPENFNDLMEGNDG